MPLLSSGFRFRDPSLWQRVMIREVSSARAEVTQGDFDRAHQVVVEKNLVPGGLAPGEELNGLHVLILPAQ